jgi:yecA family protein
MTTADLGGDEPEFATPDEAETIVAIIMARYREIIAHLDADLYGFDPVFLEGPEGQVSVTDWAAGFMDAVILRTKAWEPIRSDEDDRALILPLFVLGSDGDQPLFDVAPLSDDERETLLADGADVLMDAVPAIHRFWQVRRT